MSRAALLLLIGIGLVVFAFQNLSPLPLVILGAQTQALPLAIWVLGSVAAGVLTSLAIALLFNLSGSRAASRPRRPTGKRPTANRFSSSSWTSWQPSPSPSPTPTASYSRTTSVQGDDWEPRQPLEEWENWEGYEEADPAYTAASPNPSSDRNSQDRNSQDRNLQDRYSQDRNSQDRYSSVSDRYFDRSPEPDPSFQDQEVWDDWDEEDDFDEVRGDRRSDARAEDDRYQYNRTDFEVKQEPTTRYQSGSIYSYSYRGDSEQREPENVYEPEKVYDADYRVIIPPQRPEPESDHIAPPANARDEDEDWGDDEVEKK